MRRITAIGTLLMLLMTVSSYASLDLDVKEYTLDNGMTLLILERPAAPVVSALVRYRVGSVDERPGITGISHFLEHLLFKGTKLYGTSDYEAEAPLIAKIDSLANEWHDEYIKTKDPQYRGDTKRLEELREEMAAVQEEQKKYIIKDELWEVYQKHGGRYLNAATGEDGTQYFINI